MSSESANKIVELKLKMVEAIKETKGIDSVDSLFLIGSCSDALVPCDWYQDYDIHFLFDKIKLNVETLHWLHELVQSNIKQTTPNCKIDGFVRDRHWKMIPDDTYPINIGIHATLLNKADHYRRLHYNPVLAANMYHRCQVLYGKHPAQIRGNRTPSLFEYVHSVGGIGWLSENFARAVMLYQLVPEDHSFYPFIAGYCWNIASSLMFHLYTLDHGGYSSRKHAFDYLFNKLKQENNDDLLAAAICLYENRENPQSDFSFAKAQINAVGKIITFICQYFINSNDFNSVMNQENSEGMIKVDSLYQSTASVISNNQISVADFFRNENLEYYDSIADVIEQAKTRFGQDLSAKENFEFIRDLITLKKPHVKLRIWDRLSILRYKLSHDYDSTHARLTLTNMFFAWEDGVQALLQRLNEVYIEKSCKVDEELTHLLHFCTALVNERLTQLGLSHQCISPGDDFIRTINTLGTMIEPLVH